MDRCEGGCVSVQPPREGQGGAEGLGAFGGGVLSLWAGPGHTELGLGALLEVQSQSGRGLWPTLSILYTGKVGARTEENVEENVVTASQSPVHGSLLLRLRP